MKIICICQPSKFMVTTQSNEQVNSWSKWTRHIQILLLLLDIDRDKRVTHHGPNLQIRLFEIKTKTHNSPENPKIYSTFGHTAIYAEMSAPSGEGVVIRGYQMGTGLDEYSISNLKVRGAKYQIVGFGPPCDEEMTESIRIPA